MCMQVSSPYGEQFLLQAESQAAMNDWCSTLQTSVDKAVRGVCVCVCSCVSVCVCVWCVWCVCVCVCTCVCVCVFMCIEHHSAQEN